jgi:glycosyltransferase involved in cell wall biosynthesis
MMQTTVRAARAHDALAGARSPRVSVGLPVYNGEWFLERTLDSLLAQTFEDFEIIVCDNASTDRTAAIVADYMDRDARIRYHRNEQNRGAIFNYHRTLSLASGEYFKWMASDDIVRRDFLARAVAVLDADPHAVLAYSKAAFIDEDDCVIYRFDDVMRLEPWSASAVARTNQALRAVFRDGSAANVIVFGLARSSARRAIRPLGHYFGCDFVAVTELALLGRIHELSDVLAFYRRHAHSSSSYARSPSAARQQQFYDPSVTGRLRQELQLRRRYFEVFRAIARADLPRWQRLIVATGAAGCILRRVAWRARFELRTALGRERGGEVATDDGIGRHWADFEHAGRGGAAPASR